jgi:hypothetical protein
MAHALAAALNPQQVAREVFAVLTGEENLTVQDPRDSLLELRNGDEIERVNRRVRALFQAAGSLKVGNVKVHPKPGIVVIKGGTFSPPEVQIPLYDAVAYAINREDRSTRLGSPDIDLDQVRAASDFNILKTFFETEFYAHRLASSGTVALGLGAFIWVLASPSTVITAAAALGILGGPIVPVVLGLAATLFLIGLLSYAMIRRRASVECTASAVEALARMPGSTLEQTTRTGIEFLKAQKERNRTSGTDHILSQAHRFVLFTSDGDHRWFTHWGASINTKIALLEEIRKRADLAPVVV